MKTFETDVLVIGAGPAGAIAAALLHRENIRVLVVEKQTFPRFVIGESMLPISMDLLEDAGLLDAVQRQQFMRKNGAVILRGDETCNFDFSTQFTAGYNYTFQVPRGDFDKTLADTVAARGVDVRYRHGVTAVNFNADPRDGRGGNSGRRHVGSHGQIRPRLQRLRSRAAAPVEAGEAVRVSAARGAVHPCHRGFAPAGTRGGKNLDLHAPGRRLDLDHSVFQRQDERRGGGVARNFSVNFPAIQKRSSARF